MTITKRDTVEDIMLKQAALFNMGSDRIYNTVKDIEAPLFVALRQRGRPDKKLAPRSVNVITMQELDTIENRKTGYDYFKTCLAVMLEIDEEEVKNLRFLRAFRYFLEVQKELKQAAKEWKRLNLPLTPEERRAKVKRPNRGMLSICRQYVQLMSGAATREEAWTTPWRIIHEAFEGSFYDTLEQRRYHEIMMKKK